MVDWHARVWVRCKPHPPYPCIPVSMCTTVYQISNSHPRIYTVNDGSLIRPLIHRVDAEMFHITKVSHDVLKMYTKCSIVTWIISNLLIMYNLLIGHFYHWPLGVSGQLSVDIIGGTGHESHHHLESPLCTQSMVINIQTEQYYYDSVVYKIFSHLLTHGIYNFYFP